VGWYTDAKNFLVPLSKIIVLNLEPGEIEENIHVQGVQLTGMPTDKKHIDKFRTLLRQAIGPPSGTLKICIKVMKGRHNALDQIGYVYKSQGEPGFTEFRHGCTDDMKAEGIQSYVSVHRSQTGSNSRDT